MSGIDSSIEVDVGKADESFGGEKESVTTARKTSSEVNSSSITSLKDLVQDEDIQRQQSLEAAKSYFAREDVQRMREKIAQESDPEQRAAMVKDFCIQTNGVLMGEENPEFGVNVQVHQSEIDHEAALEWKPPRPIDDIFDEYFEEVGNLIHGGKRIDAASVLFQTITLGHPFRNGNGRTARLAFLHMLNPQLTRDAELIEKYILDEDIQAESRAVCDDILMDAVEGIKEKGNITNLPFIMMGDRTRSGGASNDMLRVAYKQIHPLDTPFVVQLYELPREEQTALRQKTSDIGKESLRNILHSPKARARTFEGMWGKQHN